MEKLSFIISFSVLTTLICSKSSTFANIYPNSTVDEESLLAFKSRITSDPSYILARNWSTGNRASLCSWVGVSCGANQRITTLDLHGWHLEGTIAPHLGNLTFLRSLDLSFNSFTGRVPEELSGLRRLKVLNLGANNLTGTIPMNLCDNLSKLNKLELSLNSLSGVIPSNIYNCKSLEILSLSANEFTGSIPKEIGEMIMLNELFLDGNNLEGGIPAEIGNLSRIEILNAGSNSISGEIPSVIFNLSSLIQLDLSFTNLSGSLPWNVQLPNLEVLELRSNRLRGQICPNLLNFRKLSILNLSHNEFIGSIPNLIFNISSLQVIDLSNNNLSGIIPMNLCDSLSQLKIFMLSWNSLSGVIPSNIHKCRSLEKLSLWANEFHGNIPKEIGELTMLKILYLDHNNLEGDIPLSIGNLSRIKIFGATNNELTGAIPKQVGNLTQLKGLGLGFNKMTGDIPSELGNLKLEILYLPTNGLSGSIPVSIFNISTLTGLSLADNHFRGVIPSNINKCTSLETLSLWANKFNGNIPKEIGELTMLQILYLDHNNLQGAIPKQIGNLTELKRLSLGHNKMTGFLLVTIIASCCFLTLISLLGVCLLIPLSKCFHGILIVTGEIPSELGNLKLEALYLSANSLSGFIPLSIFNISTLTEQLSLAENRFIGQLPRNMGISLPNLEELALYSNNLTGTIPNTLINASKLAIISISNNSFTGMVPDFGNLRLLMWLSLEKNNLVGGNPNQELGFLSSLANCPHLEILSLSSNQFNGILPTSLGNLSKSLWVFQAPRCHIKGSIPPTIGNLTGLKHINLDTNEFTGLIPKTLGELTQIERLYLGHNILQGHIPTELCRLNRLSNLYLSDNMLNGTIPACFGDLKFLSKVDLASNRLTSVVPKFWNAADLLVLDLSTNFLSGNISLEISNLKSLSYLNLSWNQFSGDIPINIGDLQSLEILSLARNHLQGSIPQSVGDLRGLVFLDISHNNISGYIPKSLESLMFLEYLDLSYNRLEGEIPKGGHFSNFTAQSFTMNYALCGDVRLQVSPCPVEGVDKSSTKHVSFIKYILAPTLVAILAVSLSIWLLQRRRANKKQNQIEISSILSWRQISYLELQRATEDFSEVSIIGRGSFGSVYRGTLSDGLNIAVKVFNMRLEGAIKSFEVECEVMSTVRHKNLVRVISCCGNIDFKALVLEYIRNGSLEKWLYSPNNSLDLLQRLNIAIDVALAMEYLHHGIPSPIIHCDLKPSNILIDEDMIAHVGDFGIAKLFGEGEAFHHTITLATIGYMAPEYGSEGKVSTSCDIYSYGITLLELFTSKKPTDDMFTEEMSLKDWVHKALQENIVTQVAAAGLLDQEDRHFSAKEQCVSSIFDLAMQCLAISPQERINMIETVVILKKIRASFLASTT